MENSFFAFKYYFATEFPVFKLGNEGSLISLDIRPSLPLPSPQISFSLDSQQMLSTYHPQQLQKFYQGSDYFSFDFLRPPLLVYVSFFVIMNSISTERTIITVIICIGLQVTISHSTHSRFDMKYQSLKRQACSL